MNPKHEAKNMTVSLSRVTPYFGDESTYFLHVYNPDDPRDSNDEDGKSANHTCLIITKQQYYDIFSDLYWD